MFLLKNKFYIIFLTIWIIGFYLVWITFRTTSDNEKVSEDRIGYLQNEVESLRQKILEMQTKNNDQPSE